MRASHTAAKKSIPRTDSANSVSAEVPRNAPRDPEILTLAGADIDRSPRVRRPCNGCSSRYISQYSCCVLVYKHDVDTPPCTLSCR
jgi:hypothetical protein